MNVQRLLRPFELRGRVYERLGVRYFKRIVPSGGDYVNRLVARFRPGFSYIQNRESAGSGQNEPGPTR